jgi:hypothetical protein
MLTSHLCPLLNSIGLVCCAVVHQIWDPRAVNAEENPTGEFGLSDNLHMKQLSIAINFFQCCLKAPGISTTQHLDIICHFSYKLLALLLLITK